MNKKILFSPVGGTDPISEQNARDGALLHISRYYKPDTIYLFMSSEVLEKHKKDNRYLKCLNFLEEIINHNFEVHIIEKPKLVDVHIFSDIYQDMHDELFKVIASMDETDELILNMSSGTPAMKSALLVLATMLDIRCTCVQVDTPSKKMNDHSHEKNPDMETLWSLNEDNDFYLNGNIAEKRCHEETLAMVKKLEIEDSIVELVKAYRYKDALNLAKKLPEKATTKYIDKLKFAAARKELNFNETNRLLDKVDLNIYNPIRRAEVHKIYEYTLALKNRAICGEISDFLRATSPLFVELFANILKKNTKFDLDNYIKIKKGSKYWDEKKLQANNLAYNALQKAYQTKFSATVIKSDHLYNLAVALVLDQNVVTCVENLRMIESEVRNVAAHEMTFTDDKILKSKTGFTSIDIVNLIQQSFNYTSFNISRDQWNSYESMNEDIIISIKGKSEDTVLAVKEKSEEKTLPAKKDSEYKIDTVIPDEETQDINEELIEDTKPVTVTIFRRVRRYRHGLRPGWVRIENNTR